MPDDGRILALRNDPAAFRFALRSWLAHHVPVGWQDRLAHDFDAHFVPLQRSWLATLESIGLAVPHWPVQWGGEGLSIDCQVTVYEELARADAPPLGLYSVAHHHVPATLHAWGTPEQVQQYVPAARCGAVWCQGFSEPEAGSDLASLRTTAVDDGDCYRTNGQKIWSSGAMHADHMLLLARTDTTATRPHDGITLFVLDMNSDGIRLQPIRQINGNAEFCQVQLDDVAIPKANVIGPVNKGWQVAQSTLATERGLSILICAERMHVLMERQLRTQGGCARSWIADDQWRREFAQGFAELQALRGLIRRMLDVVSRTGAVDATPLYVKLAYSELQQRMTDLFVRITGIEGQSLRPRYSRGYPTGSWLYDYVGSWSWTISGGTNEIIRNIVAERQLGMPREPRHA